MSLRWTLVGKIIKLISYKLYHIAESNAFYVHLEHFSKVTWFFCYRAWKFCLDHLINNRFQGISTGAIRVREKGADGMEREDADPITIELTGQYGKLETVGISQDGEGSVLKQVKFSIPIPSQSRMIFFHPEPDSIFSNSDSNPLF